MHKQQILAEIARIAQASGGKAPGREKFERETGIRMSEWYPHLWLRWGDALKEAGYAPNNLQGATSITTALQKYIDLIRELGHLPVEGELRLKEKQDPSFPSHGVFSRIGGKERLVPMIMEHCQSHVGFEDIADICKSWSPRNPERTIESRNPVVGYVYMMQSGRRYKIGFTSSPARRHREVRLDLPDPTNLVHSIETDDPRGIESYWHNRFASKRVRNTEFFELDAKDVAAFKRRKYQ